MLIKTFIKICIKTFVAPANTAYEGKIQMD